MGTGKISKLNPTGFSSLSFGSLAQSGLFGAFVPGDLVADGSSVGAAIRARW